MTDKLMMHMLPVEAYTSQEWFDREQEFIFSKVWRFAGFADDISEPGDFVTVQEYHQRNPQIASRLLNTYRNWRTLESGRRKLARKTLQRIARRKTLSPDVFEIVTKMLG